MKCISLPFRLSDSYNFLASFTSRFRKMVHNGSFLKLYIPTTLKFDRKAEISPLAPFTSVLHKEQLVATVCMPWQKQKIAFAYKVSMTHYIYTPHYKKRRGESKLSYPLSAIIVYHNFIFLAPSTRETLSSSKPPQFQENSSPFAQF